MTDFKGYYALLEVSRNATTDQIRQSFRRLARQYHPDVSRHPQAEAQFKDLNQAYEVLSDSDKRRRYDPCAQAIGSANAAVKAGKAGQSVEELQSARDQLAKAIAQLQGVPIRVEWFGLAQTALKTYQSQLGDLDKRIEALKKQREQYDQAVRLAEAAVQAGKAGQSLEELRSARDQLAKAIAQLQRVPHLAQAALKNYQSQLDDLDRQIEALKKQSQQRDQAPATGPLVIAPDKPAESVPELYKAERHKGVVFNLLISLVSGMVGAAAVVYVYSVLDAPITEPEPDEQITQDKLITEPEPDEQITQDKLITEPEPDEQIAQDEPIAEPEPDEQIAQDKPITQPELDEQIAQDEPITQPEPDKQIPQDESITQPKRDEQIAQDRPTAKPNLDERIAQGKYDQAIAIGVEAIAKPAESVPELQEARKQLLGAIAELKAIPKDSRWFSPAQKTLETYQTKLDDLEGQIEGQIGKDWKWLSLSTAVILKGHSDAVRDVEYSPDGSIIASASKDKTVRLWKSDGTLTTTLIGHSHAVNDVEYSPDGSIIASASKDKTVRLWKSDGTLITTLIGHSDDVNAVAYSPDGSTIASASSDRTVRLWKSDGTFITTLTGHSGEVSDVEYSPDGTTIASASDDKTVRLWKSDGTLITTLTGHSSPVSDVAYNPDGTTIALSEHGYFPGLDHIPFSPDNDGAVRLWKSDGTFITTLSHSSNVTAVTFSPDGTTIASSEITGYETLGRSGTVRLWKSDGSLITILKGHYDGVTAVTFSPDGTTIASAGGGVHLWKSDGTLIATLKGHYNWVNAVAFSPDGTTIASASNDKTVRLWRPTHSSP